MAPHSDHPHQQRLNQLLYDVRDNHVPLWVFCVAFESTFDQIDQSDLRVFEYSAYNEVLKSVRSYHQQVREHQCNGTTVLPGQMLRSVRHAIEILEHYSATV